MTIPKDERGATVEASTAQPEAEEKATVRSSWPQDCHGPASPPAPALRSIHSDMRERDRATAGTAREFYLSPHGKTFKIPCYPENGDVIASVLEFAEAFAAQKVREARQEFADEIQHLTEEARKLRQELELSGKFGREIIANNEKLQQERDAQAHVMRVLMIATEFDCASDLVFHLNEYGQLELAANCSDCFFWGCADAEGITPKNFELYATTLKECEELKCEKGFASVFADELFCARVRKMRPQGASYHLYPHEMWPLFDVCGSERTTEFGNPKPQPKTKEESKGWNMPRRDTYEKVCEARERAEHILQNLLAVIHRDGGHYVAAHGLQKASEDAEKLVQDERERAETALREIMSRLPAKPTLAILWKIREICEASGTERK